MIICTSMKSMAMRRWGIEIGSLRRSSRRRLRLTHSTHLFVFTSFEVKVKVTKRKKKASFRN